MTKLVHFLYIAPFIFFSTFVEAADVRVVLENIRSGQGNIMLALHNRADNFPRGTPFMAKGIKARTGQLSVIFPDVPTGNYAIALFHDENANGKLDSNFLGIPKEGYGVSRNASASFGPPSMQDALFTVGTQNVSTNIKLRY